MNYGRSLLGTALSLTLALSFPAYAAEKSCVEAFRHAKTEFTERMAKLRNDEVNSYAGMGISAAAFAVCMGVLKAGIIARGACGLLFAGTGAAAFGYGSTTRTKIARLHDAYRLFSIYEAHAAMDPQSNKEAQTMMKNLGVDIQKEQKALEEFATLMEFGKLCEGDMPRTYDEAMGLMKDRLHAAE